MISVISLLGILTACSQSTDSELSYSGLTTPATLTQAISQDTVASVIDGVSFVDDMGAKFGKLDSSSRNTIIQARRSANGSNLRSRASSPTVKQSNCSAGTQTRILTFNESTLDFQLEIDNNDYCESQNSAQENGKILLLGVLDENLQESDIQLKFEDYSSESTAQWVSINGDISGSFNQAGIVDLTVNLIDHLENQEVFLENVRITLVEGETDESTTYVDEEISGRFYLSALGYMDVETNTPLRFISNSSTPVSGVMVFSGAAASQLKLTIQASAQYQLDIDEDGDGNFELSDSGSWTELNKGLFE